MVPLLNNELVLEAPVEVADGGGGVSVEWQALGTVWAEIASVRAREGVRGGRGVSAVTHRITIRNAASDSPRRPRADCRFRRGERVFAIRGVAPLDRRAAYLTCWAEEGPFA
jgi:SPP1 family predicted phage head-tail adaptor